MMKALKIILGIFAILCFQGCTKPIDFDQIDAAEIKANYILTQAYFNLGSSNFLDEFGIEIPLQNDVIQAQISGSSQKHIEKIEFTFVTQNSFDRAFNVQIVLFDVAQNPIYFINPTIQIPANSGELTTTIEIPKEDIAVIFTTEYFSFFVQLLPSTDGSVISLSDDATLHFKSYVELFLNYKTA